jgi:hypothetical protein
VLGYWPSTTLKGDLESGKQLAASLPFCLALFGSIFLQFAFTEIESWISNQTAEEDAGIAGGNSGKLHRVLFTFLLPQTPL